MPRYGHTEALPGAGRRGLRCHRYLWAL